MCSGGEPWHAQDSDTQALVSTRGSRTEDGISLLIVTHRQSTSATNDAGQINDPVLSSAARPEPLRRGLRPMSPDNPRYQSYSIP